MKHRRDATRVIRDILALAYRGLPKTSIIYRANLNFRIADSYIDFLLSKSYITKTIGNEVGRGYELTQAGERLLLLLQRVEIELNDLFYPATRTTNGSNPPRLKSESTQLGYSGDENDQFGAIG